MGDESAWGRGIVPITPSLFWMEKRRRISVCVEWWNHPCLSDGGDSHDSFPKSQGFKVLENGKIELSLCLWEGKRQKPIIVYASHLPAGQIKEIEFCYDNGPYLAVSFEDGCCQASCIPKTSAGVDLGEIHSIAAFQEHGEALIVTGRKLRSIHRLRHKKLAELKRLQSKCNKVMASDGYRVSKVTPCIRLKL